MNTSAYAKKVDEHINDMLKRDVIEPSSSPWASNIGLVKRRIVLQGFASTTEC
jgi:hypothetical protein